jgi:hypothetical protein
LIDFYSYALNKRWSYDPWSFHKISVAVVEEIAHAQGVTFQPGDILFLRTGIIQPLLSTAPFLRMLDIC